MRLQARKFFRRQGWQPMERKKQAQPELDLSILTEKQKSAYLLHRQGLTLQEIGNQMGTSASTARYHLKGADLRLREVARYEARLAQRLEQVDFPLTRVELELIGDGLELLFQDFRKAAARGANSHQWQHRIAPETKVVEALLRRIDSILGSKTPESLP